MDPIILVVGAVALVAAYFFLVAPMLKKRKESIKPSISDSSGESASAEERVVEFQEHPEPEEDEEIRNQEDNETDEDSEPEEREKTPQKTKRLRMGYVDNDANKNLAGVGLLVYVGIVVLFSISSAKNLITAILNADGSASFTLTPAHLFIALLAVLIYWALLGVKVVRPDYFMVAMITGTPFYTFETGIGWYPPRIGEAIMVSRKVVSIDIRGTFKAETRDKTRVKVDGKIFVCISDPVAWLFNVDDAFGKVEDMGTEAFNAAPPWFTLEEIISVGAKNSIKKSVFHTLRVELEKKDPPWGVRVTDVVVEDISQPASIAKMQEKLRLAQMEKERNIRLAEAYAALTLGRAEADSQAIRILQDQLGPAGWMQLERLKAEVQMSQQGNMIVTTGGNGGQEELIKAVLSLLNQQRQQQNP